MKQQETNLASKVVCFAVKAGRVGATFLVSFIFVTLAFHANHMILDQGGSNNRNSRKRPRPMRQQRTWWWPLVFVLLTSCSSGKAWAKKYYNERDQVSSISSLMVCRITMEGTIYARNVADMYSLEQTVCIPIRDETEDPETYAIQLPDYIETTYRQDIRRGKLHLLITGAKIEKDTIATTSRTRFSVIKESLYSRGRQLQNVDENHSNAVGLKRYAIIRISTSDSKPTVTMDQLVQRFTDATEGVEAQYRDCSHNQLFLYLSGAYDVQLSGTVQSYSANPRIMRDSAVEQIVKDHSIATFPNDVADHVLFVIPPGTGTWVANAATSHFRSQYNDVWGISLSAVMVRVNNLFRGTTHENVQQSL